MIENLWMNLFRQLSRSVLIKKNLKGDSISILKNSFEELFFVGAESSYLHGVWVDIVKTYFVYI